jgi:xanthine dehydrogenase YagS FAD-binding subunit
LKAFKHLNAGSVEEAVSLLKEYEGRAVLVAGGTDLLGILKSEVLPRYPDVVINIKTIPGIHGIKENQDGLSIGALARLGRISMSHIVRERYAMLAEASHSVATPEIRNMATIGGNLCQDTRCWYYRYPHRIGGRILCKRKGEGPCYAIRGDNRYHAVTGGKGCFAVCPSDTATALTALDAVVRIAGPGRERTVPVEEFYHSMGNVLGPDEVATEIHVPLPLAGTYQVFHKFRVRDSVDFAIASVAVRIFVSEGICEDASIVLGAVAPTPFRAREAEDTLKGKKLDSKEAEAAGEASVVNMKPLGRNGYKIDIIRTLVRRAVLSLICLKEG